jgi:hypothetical protein
VPTVEREWVELTSCPLESQEPGQVSIVGCTGVVGSMENDGGVNLIKIYCKHICKCIPPV